MRVLERALITGISAALLIPGLAAAAGQAQTGTGQNPQTSSPVAQASPAATPASSTPAPADSPTAKATGIVLPAGSTLHVRLLTTLTSKTSKTGDKFSAYVEQPVAVSGQDVVPVGSLLDGHVVFVKNSKRVKGVGQMRIVPDDITTESGEIFRFNGTLDSAQGSPCAKSGSDDEGTLKGCGKSKKDALKAAGIGGAMGAGAGAGVGMGHEIDCEYFGNCGGPGFGADIGYGAAIGATAAIVYNIFKHEKPLMLIQGTHLTFTVDRSVKAAKMPPENLNNPAGDAMGPAGGLP